jgi:hypothetical protein
MNRRPDKADCIILNTIPDIRSINALILADVLLALKLLTFRTITGYTIPDISSSTVFPAVSYTNVSSSTCRFAKYLYPRIRVYGVGVTRKYTWLVSNTGSPSTLFPVI